MFFLICLQFVYSLRLPLILKWLLKSFFIIDFFQAHSSFIGHQGKGDLISSFTLYLVYYLLKIIISLDEPLLKIFHLFSKTIDIHCVKNVLLPIFFWSLFSHIFLETEMDFLRFSVEIWNVSTIMAINVLRNSCT